MTASRQAGPDALVEEVVRGVPLRCYAQRPHSVVEVLERALTTSADDVLLIDPTTGTTTTYDGFARLVEGASATLLARGLEPGDRVAVLARNSLEAAIAIWACARAGLVHVGIPVDAPPARVAALLELTGASLLLAQPGLLDAALAESPVVDADELLLGREIDWRTGQPLPDQDTTYSLIPTSGTTGHPKAVQVTGRMLGHAAAFYTRTLGLTRQDRTAIHLPFAWVSGHVTQLTPAMLSGGSAVTMATFSAGQLVAVAAEHGVTWLDVVPSIWELLLRAEGFALPALSGVRLAVFGGAPAPPGTLDRVRERLPQLRLFDVYALSETCAPVTCLSDTEALRRPGTVGRPAPYCEVRLVAPDACDVPRGEAGEIWVRSPAVTPGYWGGTSTPVTADGWLRTGDLGRMDAEGYLQVGGRAVDLIIRGGVNIYPAEVERALFATGLLADAVAVGIPSAVTGHNVGAAVVAAPGTDPDRHVLQAAVRAALGAHAVPRPLRVVAELPRNRNGKVDRQAVLTGLLAPDG
ncbi:MAG: acyl--CoA ligase [Actinomycetota bacterium]|nr:acyl--CoA ligase [Actinomycetota bacterium]